MSTSGTYTFGSTPSLSLIEDAYERIGITPPNITLQKILSAQRSLNFILQEWVNKGNNLWTIKKAMLGLTDNQNTYNMPPNGIDIKTAAIRTSTRNLGGTPFSSAGGTASYAFDGNPATACTQTSPNGYISYNWGATTYAINMVGVQANVTNTYTLVGEYSLDNITWVNVLTVDAQVYPQRVLQWFSVPIPVPAAYFRIRETGGAILDIQELYFNTSVQDYAITRLSEVEYTYMPRKGQTGRPYSFYVDRQINPVIYLYPTPQGSYNNLYFTYWRAIQDAGAMLDSAEVPARFLEPLCAALAFKLSVKEGAQDRIQMLQALAEQAYDTAGEEDRERVPLRIYGSSMYGWGAP